MAHVVIAAFGSRGDLVPLTDFGVRLREAGHDVVMTATPDLVDEITACGLQARPVDFELDHDMDPDKPRKAAMEMVSPEGMRKLGGNVLAALADVLLLLLLSPFAELAGHPLAEARDIPSIGVRLQPLSTTAAFPPSLLGAWSAGPIINRNAGHFATAMFDRIYGKTIAGFRDRLGVPRRSQRALRRQRTHPEWPVLHGFSPNVVARPGDWRPGLEVTGYWWPRRPIGWEPPIELAAFLESGSAPVFLGLGSLMLAKGEATRVSEIVRQALRTVGVRGVVQAGGASLDVVDDSIITIGSVPHDWLFSKVAAVAHSCGAGTMAAGLRAGLPAVAIPSPGGDQPFWARRLHELGVSSATLPRPKLTAERLARAIDTALTEPSHRTHAQQLAARIAEEDGAAAVVTAVEKLVDRPKPR
ncbi:glycosyltransferase [Nocardia sp. NBC_01499]|uniref:glycosyltransferase n=1 Tax=Nocardia sp. NBC_01499 TaxID=2903597 RepID=UPI00386ED3E9